MMGNVPTNGGRNWACYIEWNIILTLLSISATVIIYWSLYKYFNSAAKKAAIGTHQKLLFYAPFLYIMVVGSYFLLENANVNLYCFNFSLYTTMQTVLGFVYSGQLQVLLIILFVRLYKVFQGTSLAISRCTTITYVTVYALTSFDGAAQLFVWFNPETRYDESLIFFFLIYFFLTSFLNIYLVSLFVWKLLQVQRLAKGQKLGSHSLIIPATKNTVLTIVSVISSTLTTTALFARPYLGGDRHMHAEFLLAVVAVVDIFTNFLSIALGLNVFHKEYLLLCGCCDGQMRRMCNRVAHGGKREKIVSQTDLTINIGHGGVASKTLSTDSSAKIGLSGVTNTNSSEMTATPNISEFSAGSAGSAGSNDEILPCPSPVHTEDHVSPTSVNKMESITTFDLEE